MIEIFPTTVLDYALLFLGTFAAASALSAILPLRWGWKAFPLVPLGLLLILAGIVMGTGIMARDQGEAWGAAVSSRLLLLLLMTIPLAFAIVRAVRLRRSNRDGPCP
jgi:hypothetical protein